MTRRLLSIAVLTLLAASSWAGTARAQAPGTGPGGPVLVVAADGFGRYNAEILRAEGLNAFSVVDVGALGAPTLSGYQTVLLGAGAVSDAQVAALTAWAQGGGNLIAMRPDPKLAGLLGIGADDGDVAEGYIGVDTTSAPGAGITPTTMQYHGAADRWALAGARQVAALYSDASTPTGTPAVTLRDVGTSGGSAAAFAYDLARSVVYTRQGDPATPHAVADPPDRSHDLFMTNWLDFSRVAIPQADEHQRLLANMITQMSIDHMPLPRFWYLPRGEMAAVVMTGDDHDPGAGSDTVAHFNRFKAKSPAGCSVDDWECVRSTSYVYPNVPIPPNDAAQFTAEGFEIALHLWTGCHDWTDAEDDLRSTLASQLNAFSASWPDLPAPRTNRTHCVVWSDWAGQPREELAKGIRLDTNYYYWPDTWTLARRPFDHPGVFTGSGFPMRFADLDGSIIDVYQATTQLTDELDATDYSRSQHVPMHIAALLDAATGANGYYGVFTMNMHTDAMAPNEFGQPVHQGADAIVAAAQDRGVPVVSAAQMLDWLDGRNGSTFTGLSYAGGRLQFGVARAAGSRGLQGMVPAAATGGALISLTREGAPVDFSSRVVKGVAYAVFPAEAGQYVATYPPPPGSGGTAAAPSGEAADRVAPRLKVKTRRARVTRQGKVVLRVKCPRSEARCRVQVRLRFKGKRIASARKTVAGGRTAKLTLKLSRSARRRLARKGSMRVQAVWKTRDAAGNVATKKTRVKLLAPRR